MYLYILYHIETDHFSDGFAIDAVSHNENEIVNLLIMKQLICFKNGVEAKVKAACLFKEPSYNLKNESLEEWHLRQCLVKLDRSLAKDNSLDYFIERRISYEHDNINTHTYSTFIYGYDKTLNKFTIASCDNEEYLESPLLHELNKFWGIYYPQSLNNIAKR